METVGVRFLRKLLTGQKHDSICAMEAICESPAYEDRRNSRRNDG